MVECRFSYHSRASGGEIKRIFPPEALRLGRSKLCSEVRGLSRVAACVGLGLSTRV